MGNANSTEPGMEASDAAGVVHKKIAQIREQKYAEFKKKYHDAALTKPAPEVITRQGTSLLGITEVVNPSRDSFSSTDSEILLDAWEPRKDRNGKPSLQAKVSEDSTHIGRQGGSGINNLQSNGASRPAAAINGEVTTVRTMKRPATSFEEARRVSAPKLSTQASTISQTSLVERSGPSSSSVAAAQRLERQPPAWYHAMKAPQSRTAGSNNAGTQLARLKSCITSCKKVFQQSARVPEKDFDQIRGLLHNLAFLELSRELVRQQRMLHNSDGLPQLFDDSWTQGVDWPWDVKTDAEELYKRWSLEVFETDLLRGIVPPKPKSRTTKASAARLKPDHQRLMNPKTYGSGNLLNGQWWPTQLAALRDGAVGSSQGGISGVTGHGATAVIMSGGADSEGKHYPDVDNGKEVYYCGTDSTDGTPTALTQHLLDSVTVGKEPVRLLRSSNLKSQYAPELGLRYDGLYEVVSFEMIDPEGSLRQRHRFHLRRLPGQHPIRGGTGPEKRPTQQEISAYNKERALYGLK